MGVEGGQHFTLCSVKLSGLAFWVSMHDCISFDWKKMI